MSHSFTRGQSITFTYLGLSDTPGSYVGDALKILRVNAGESALEHVALTTSIVTEGSNLYFTNERVDDEVAALIQNGTGISWSYNDGLNTLTPTISLASFSTTNLAEGTNLYYTQERAQDAIGLNWSDTATLNFTYNDPAGTFSADVIDDSSIQKIEVVKNSGAVVGTRKQLNFIEGTGITLTIADDSINGQIDITIDSSGISTHALLDSTVHTDTTTGTVARGDLITGQGGTPTWTRLAKGTANQIFQSDGTDIGWVSLSGDATLAAGVLTIANDAVTFAKFQNITDNRLLGRSAGSAGDMMEITIGAGLSLAAGALSSTITQYTDTMAKDAVGAILTDSASINFTYVSASSITAVVTPAGSDTYVQFNDGGILGADAQFVYNKTTNYLTVGTGSTGVIESSYKLKAQWLHLDDSNYNFFIGNAAPNSQETIAIGYGAVASGTGNTQIIAIGKNSASLVRNAQNIISIGWSAMGSTGYIESDGIVAIGDYTGSRLQGTTANYNTGVGHASMAGQILGGALTGAYNSFYGAFAGMYAQNNMSYATIIGAYSGFNLSFNNQRMTTLGAYALYTEGLTTGQGSDVTAVGAYSLYTQDGGDRNTALGAYTGYLVTTGDRLVLLGYKAGYNLTTESDLFIVANNDTTELMRGDFVTGDILIQRSISLTLGSDAEGDIYFRDSSGYLDRIAAHATPGYVLMSNGAATAPSYQAVTAGSISGGAALTKVDDTNVTLTLGGSPSSALLAAASLTLGWSGQLSLARGGTNKNITAVAGAVVWTDADSMELTAAGTTGQALVAGGTGSPTWFAPTAGSVIFAGTGGILQQDNTNFFWDDANNRLGIGNTIAGTPFNDLHIRTNNSEVKMMISNDNGAGDSNITLHNPGTNTNTSYTSWRLYGTSAVGSMAGTYTVTVPVADLALFTFGSHVYNILFEITNGSFILATNNGGGNSKERLRIGDLGDVTWTLSGDATGDIYYRNASGYFKPLAIGAPGMVLGVVSTVPEWINVSVVGGTGSVTSTELSAVSAQAKSAIDVVSNALSVETAARVAADDALSQQISVLSQAVSVADAALSVRIDTQSNSISVISQQVSVLSQLHSALSQQVSALSTQVSLVSVAVTSVDTRVNTVSSKISAICAISALSTDGSSVQGLQSVINALSNRISANSGTGGGGSVTSQELSVAAAGLSVRIDTQSQSISVLSQQVSVLSQAVSAADAALSVRIDGNSNAISILSQQVSVLSQAVSSQNAALSVRIDTQSQSISVLSQGLSVLSQAVSSQNAALSVRIDTQSQSISVLSQQISALSQAHSALSQATSAALAALSVRVDTQSQGISVLSQQVSVLSQLHSALSQQVSALSSQVSVVSVAVTSVDTRLNSLSQLHSVLSQQVSALSSQVSAVSVAVTSVDTRLNTVSQQVSVLSNKMSALCVISAKSTNGTSVQGLQSVINALSNRISANSGVGGGGGSVTSTELSAALVNKADTDNAWLDVSTATYTFSAGDNDKILRFTTNVTSIVATVPTGLSTGWHVVVYRATGSGVLYISSQGTKEGTGFTLSSQNTMAAIYHRGGDVHVVQGADGVSTGLSNMVSVLSNQISALSSKVSVISAQVAALTPPQVKTASNNQVISATALTNISGMSVTVSAGGIYRLEAMILVNRGAATQPVRMGLTFPTMTNVRGWIDYALSASQPGTTASSQNVQAIFNGNSASGSVIVSTISATTLSNIAQYTGLFVPSANGTIQLQAYASSGASQITILAGSYVKLFKIA